MIDLKNLTLPQLEKEIGDLRLNIEVIKYEIDSVTHDRVSGFGVYWTLRKSLWVYRSKKKIIEEYLDKNPESYDELSTYRIMLFQAINFE